MKSEFSRFQMPEIWQSENKQLYNNFRAAGITKFSEQKILTENPDFTKPPFTWGVKPG